MFKNLLSTRSPMTHPPWLGVVLIVLCAPSILGQDTSLATRIKRIAAEYNASTRRTSSGALYELYAFQSPRGYRALITLLEPDHGPPTVAVRLYENLGSAYVATLLVDNGANGSVDYVISATGPTPEQARKHLEAHSGSITPLTPDLNAAYQTIVDCLQHAP